MFQSQHLGIHVVGKESCKKTRSWKVLSWKVRNEIGKIKVGKFGPKLQSSRRSWKVQLKLESDLWSWKVWIELVIFQLRWVLSNFLFFPTALSKYTYPQYLFLSQLSYFQIDNVSNLCFRVIYYPHSSVTNNDTKSEWDQLVISCDRSVTKPLFPVTQDRNVLLLLSSFHQSTP